MAWLPIHVDQDGLSSLLQVWDSAGHAACSVHSATVTGSDLEFRVRWSREFPDASLVQAIGWVPFVSGSAQPGVVRLWNRGAPLVYDFFRWMGDPEGFALMSSVATGGPPCSG